MSAALLISQNNEYTGKITEFFLKIIFFEKLKSWIKNHSGSSTVSWAKKKPTWVPNTCTCTRYKWCISKFLYKRWIFWKQSLNQKVVNEHLRTGFGKDIFAKKNIKGSFVPCENFSHSNKKLDCIMYAMFKNKNISQTWWSKKYWC